MKFERLLAEVNVNQNIDENRKKIKKNGMKLFYFEKIPFIFMAWRVSFPVVTTIIKFFGLQICRQNNLFFIMTICYKVKQ